MSWSDLYRYWEAKFVNWRPRSRRDIDPPIEIPRLIGNLALIDVEPAAYRYRLIGTKLVRAFRRDSTGQTIDKDLLGPTTLATWLGILDVVSKDRRPQLVTMKFPPAAAATLALALPLVGRDGANGEN